MNNSHRFLLIEKNGDRENLLYDADELEDVGAYVNLKVGAVDDLPLEESLLDELERTSRDRAEFWRGL